MKYTLQYGCNEWQSREESESIEYLERFLIENKCMGSYSATYAYIEDENENHLSDLEEKL